MAVAGAWQRAQKIVAGRFHRKLAIRSLPRPIVTFTFDDFPRSAVTTGATVLNEFGARGTYFAALGLMGKTTPVGDMFLQPDLDAVLNAGHELACHTYDHVLCSQISVDELLRNCERNRERMAELLGGYRPVNFSFPEGVVTPLAKKRLSSVYKTCRTIEPGINADPIDLGFLRAYRVYSSSRIDALKTVIQANQRNKGWLCLYTHDISPEPSPWGCTPEQFRAVVAFAAKSDAQLISVREAANSLEAAVAA